MTLRQAKRRAIPAKAIFILLAFGIALTALSLPPLAAAYYGLQAKDTVTRVTNGGTAVANDELATAIGDLTIATSADPGNRTQYNQLATVAFRLLENYRDAGDDPRARDYLGIAHSYLIAGLRKAPGSANIWYLRSETENRLNGTSGNALNCLQMSYLTGPREYWVMRRRLLLGLNLWDRSSKTNRYFVRREITSLRLQDLAKIYKVSTEFQKSLILGETNKKQTSKELLKIVKHL